MKAPDGQTGQSTTIDAASDPVAAWVARVLAEAPPLSAEQRARLRELLRPVRITAERTA